MAGEGVVSVPPSAGVSWDVEEAQRRWSATADVLGDRIGRWRAVVLVLGVLGVVLATLAAELSVVSGPATRVLSLLAGVALALIGFVRAQFLSPGEHERWTRTRAGSERLKSEIYRYRTRIAPYEDDRDRDEQLSSAYDRVLAGADDLLPLITSQPPRGPDRFAHVQDVPSYVEIRIGDQISEQRGPDGRPRGYYPRLALAARTRLRRFHRIGLALTLAGTALGVVGSEVGEGRVSIWVGLVTTLTGAVSTHVTTSRFDFQATTYLATARRLESLVRHWRLEVAREPATSVAAGAAFVRACEDAIERENTGWTAEWTKAGDVVSGQAASSGPGGSGAPAEANDAAPAPRPATD